MRGVTVILAVGAFAASCSSDGEYGVVVRVPGAVASATRVEVDVVPSCQEAPVTTGGDPESSLRHVTVSTGESEALGHLPDGLYGLYARAWDANCRLYAAGCQPFQVSAGGSGSITVILAELAQPADCPPPARCVEGVCQRSGDPDAGPPDAGADGSVEPDGSAPGDAGLDGSVEPDASPDAGGPDCPGDLMPGEQTVTIEDDHDDAMWNAPWTFPDERLVYERPDNLTLYVSNDGEQQVIALRFSLDVPRCATVDDAFLDATVGEEVHELADTVQVAIWDSITVPAFSDDHVERPDEHDPAGLWGTRVRDWVLDARRYDRITSPNLAELVQHLVDRNDWQPGGIVGFLIEEDAMAVGSYLGFVDVTSAEGPPASLTVRWH